MPKYLFHLLLTGTFVVACISCRSEDQTPVAPVIPPETVSIIYPPELRGFMGQALETFYNNDQRLPNGASLHFERIEEFSLPAARQIARGEMKTVMWITPLPALAEHVNNTLINLGARQTECKKIFSSPLVVASDRAVTRKIFPGNDYPSRAAVLSGTPAHVLNVLRPDMSDAGVLATLYLHRQQRDSPIVPTEQIQGLRAFGDIDHLLKVLSVNLFGSSRITLTTEQSIIKHNKQNSPEERRIEATYLGDMPPELEYTACISDADWLKPAQRAGALLLQKHLLSQDAQIAAQREGFRAVQYNTDKLGSFSAEVGVQPSVPVKSEVVPLTQVESALKNASLFSPKTATMYVMDISASMQGVPVATIKRLVRVLIEKEDKDNLSGVIAFNANVQLISPPTTQRPGLYPYILGLETDGGSALYDAILLAAEQLAKDEYRDMQRRIVLITDGNDQSSHTVLSFFGSAFERKANGQEIAVSTLLLKRPGIDLSDLRQITSILGGALYEYDTTMTPEAITQLINSN